MECSGWAGRIAAHQRDPAGAIIAGHGRFGGIVKRRLRGIGYETVVVDYSSQQLEIRRRFCVRVCYGDATRLDLLQAAGIGNAKLFVIAIADRKRVTRSVRHVVENYPQVHVIARAWDRNHTFELWSVGCRDIIREICDGAIRTGRKQRFDKTLFAGTGMRAWNLAINW